MTDNNVDIDDTGDLDQQASAPGGAKPGLKEAWQSNPLLKVAALVVVGAVVVGAYMTLTKPNPLDETKSAMASNGLTKIKATPGQEALDKKYTEAIQDRNKQVAQKAIVTGTSAISTPIASMKDHGIEIPQTANSGEEDPLKEWKKNVEAKRVKVEEKNDEAEVEAPQPDLVPMVQPIHPQPVMKLDPAVIGQMSGQMNTLISTQVPGKSQMINVTQVDNDYTKMLAEQSAAKSASGQTGAQGSGAYGRGTGATAGTGMAAGTGTGTAATPKLIISPGQIAYAQLLTELNSDVPSPVLATMMSGPFEGGRLMGKMSTQDEYIVITFDRIIKDGVSYRINGIALDQNTTLPAQQGDVDHHYFERIILPAAAAFVQGYGSSVAQTGTTTTTTSGGGVASSTPKPNARENVMTGLGQSAQIVGSMISQQAATVKPTIMLHRGTTMGILFMDSVKTSSAEQ